MARTTKTPHKVSRNKSGSPIVRASKLSPVRPTRTTRETAFETEQQARVFPKPSTWPLCRTAIGDGSRARTGLHNFATSMRCFGCSPSSRSKPRSRITLLQTARCDLTPTSNRSSRATAALPSLATARRRTTQNARRSSQSASGSHQSPESGSR